MSFMSYQYDIFHLGLRNSLHSSNTGYEGIANLQTPQYGPRVEDLYRDLV